MTPVTPAVKRPQSSALAQEFVGVACLFCLSILAIMSLAFLADAPRVIDDAFLAGLAPICAWVGWRCFVTRRFGHVVGAAVFAALLTAACLAFQSATYDISFDGMSYHLVSVIAFLRGWNPLTAASVVDWLSSHAGARDAALVSTISMHGIWSDHYPKASWILGAAASALTGTIATANWLQPFLCIVSLVAAHRLFSGLGLKRMASLLLAIGVALSPVALSQLATNYVDGLVGSALLIEISGLGCWILTRDRLDFATACAGLILASNFKFTGLVYGLIYISCLVLFDIFRSPPRGTDLKMIVAAALVSAIGCLPTYALNTALEGHPFYPINNIDVMKDQQPEAFLAQARFEKYYLANIQPIASSRSLVDVAALRDSYYRLGVTPDARTAGFGGLFSVILLIAFASVVLSTAIRRKCGDGEKLFLVLIATTFLSVLVNPEFWWARFVPQLWFLPFFCCVVLLLQKRRYAAWVVFCGLGMSTLVAAATWVRFVSIQMRAQQVALVRFGDVGRVGIWDDYVNTYGLFTLNRIGTERGFAVSRSPLPAADCITQFGIVRICEQPPPSD